MLTKYGFDIMNEIMNADCRRLTNQLWKLIPMRENNEDWESHLIVVIEEISGLSKVLDKELNFVILLSKLEGLTAEVCEDFMVYRKTVFRCIELLNKVMQDGK